MDEREPLTDRQKQALDFIAHSITDRGYPPTLREIGEHMGIRSTNGVNDHLKALEKKGYLLREDLKSRALRPLPSAADVAQKSGSSVTHSSGAGATATAWSGGLPGGFPANGNADWVDVPVVGRVAAGAPLLARENVEDTVRVDRLLLGNHQEVFALRVKGESMIDDGIHDGDFLFVKKSFAARPGDIVVALIDDEATVKRYYPEGDVIRFQPANATMQPILVRKDEFKQVSLIGVVVGVYRQVA